MLPARRRAERGVRLFATHLRRAGHITLDARGERRQHLHTYANYLHACGNRTLRQRWHGPSVLIIAGATRKFQLRCFALMKFARQQLAAPTTRMHFAAAAASCMREVVSLYFTSSAVKYHERVGPANLINTSRRAPRF
jgi:hypothetical protein